MTIDKKVDGFGAGLAEGMLITCDPVGIAAQYIGQKMGYDIKTWGGVGVFGTEPGTDVVRPEQTFGNWVSKGGLSVNALFVWANPLAWPYLVAVEGVATVMNIGANIYRYKMDGTLKLKKGEQPSDEEHVEQQK